MLDLHIHTCIALLNGSFKTANFLACRTVYVRYSTRHYIPLLP